MDRVLVSLIDFSVQCVSKLSLEILHHVQIPRTRCSRQRDKTKQTDGSPVALFNLFVQRVRDQLHVVLAMSPIGDAFRNRLRKFPSLVNCCTIDWFQVSLKRIHHGFMGHIFLCASRMEGRKVEIVTGGKLGRVRRGWKGK